MRKGLFGLLALALGLLSDRAFAQTHIIIPESNGVQLQARLYLPAGPVIAPGIVALHGCAGPMPRRDNAWALLLAGEGHPVLLPDSYTSRGLKPECKQSSHGANAYGPRRGDALAAASWLQAQKFSRPGGILLLGWSDGGTTVLASIGPGMPAGLIRAAVAFYPACTRTAKNSAWHNFAPLLILIGAEDDWTPAAPCQALAGRNPGIKIKLFPGAYHDFDVPDDPVHEIHGLPYTKNGKGTAHAGENQAARNQAMQLVPTFFAAR
jgi:dienelactone hydrolase